MASVNIFLLIKVYCIFIIITGKKYFTRDFGTENLGGPMNFIFSATDRKIGVIDSKKNLIYLIGKERKDIDRIPVKRSIDVLNREVIG